MLTDVLGVVIAFVSIILLLSMVVTAMVHATQSLLRLRGRNLKHGVKNLVETYSSLSHQLKVGGEARKRAARVLNSSKIATVDRVAYPESLTRRMLGPKVSWADPNDLAEAIQSELIGGEGKTETIAKSGDANPSPSGSPAIDKIRKDIEKMEPAWSKRFAFFIRVITVGWAVIVAFAFQVSAPDLFSALSNDPARVKLIGAQANAILKEAEVAMAEDEYDLISDNALDQLAAKYPAYKEQIDQAGNAAPSKELLVQQLADVLPNDAKRPEILATYSALIDTLAQQKNTGSRSNGASAVDRLSAFGIQFWKDDAFYTKPDGKHTDWQSVFGVLFTAILLSFGAPFWFERLRDVGKLRDIRAPT